MTTKRVRVNNSYDCPLCGAISSVEFEMQELDGDGGVTGSVRQSVVDYGACKVAGRANARNPTANDLATCPIFRSK